MKKYLCTLAVVGLAATALGATGQINMANNASTLLKNSNGVGVAKDAGFIEFFFAPAGTPIAQAWDSTKFNSLAGWLTANPGWQAVATTIKPVNVGGGRFANNVVDVPTTDNVAGAIAAWTGGATFDAALAATGGEVGISGAFAIKPGNPNATPVAELPASTAGLFPGLTLAPGGAIVPEPSSLALAGLGAAALLIFRRK